MDAGLGYADQEPGPASGSVLVDGEAPESDEEVPAEEPGESKTEEPVEEKSAIVRHGTQSSRYPDLLHRKLREN